MNTPFSPCRRRLGCRAGFTLIEISLVIGLVIALIAFVGLNVGTVRDWQRGKNASLSLQAVFAAQRSYMADHPTANITQVTSTQLQPYLPTGWSSMPTFTSLEGDALTLNFNQMPPRLYLGNAVYDPSNNNADGLWDVNE